jgi:serpin B
MHSRAGMRLRTTLLTASLPVLALVAACGSTVAGKDTSAGGSDSSSGGSPSTSTTMNIPQAKGAAPRLPASQVSAATLAAAVSANNGFAVDLYGQLLGGAGTSNLLTSPLSASLALSMAYAGAQGQTATQMATVLHAPASPATLFQGQDALAQALAGRGPAALAGDEQTAKGEGQPAPSPSNYQLQVVNSVWGQTGIPWATPFLNVLSADYGTGVYQLDFAAQPEQARATINTWVSNETSDKVNGLLPMGSIDMNTQMVLVNAIHLKLPWASASAFSTSTTADADFTTGAGTTVSAPFMNQTSGFQYVDDGKAQIVALPLYGGQLQVVIALPHGDLATYEAGLTAGSNAIAVPGSASFVELSLPKFTFTSPTFSLASALKAMGMQLAFEKNVADFQGLTSDPAVGKTLYISDVLQKATIGVQETGVEAAAATAVIFESSGAGGGFGPPPTPVPMIVDRPFLVTIVDQPTGAVLFLGHVEDPTDAGGS